MTKALPYTAALTAAIDRGYLTLHPSGAYVTFTQARTCSREAGSFPIPRLSRRWQFARGAGQSEYLR